MKLLSFCAVLALLCALSAPSAMGQDVVAPTTPGSFLNVLLGAVAMILTTVIIPLAVLWGRQMIAERELKLKQIQESARGVVGGLGQKAIGSEVGTDGALKEGAIPRAAATLARNAAESFADLGVNEDQRSAKALEVIKSTVGLMNAQAAGNPVPNPSQPIAAPPTQTVNVAKK